MRDPHPFFLRAWWSSAQASILSLRAKRGDHAATAKQGKEHSSLTLASHTSPDGERQDPHPVFRCMPVPDRAILHFSLTKNCLRPNELISPPELEPNMQDLEIATRILNAAMRALRQDGRDHLAARVPMPGATRLTMRRGTFDWWADVHVDGKMVCAIDMRALGVYDIDGELVALDEPLIGGWVL